MSAGAVVRFVVAYLIALAVLCVLVHREFSLHPLAEGEMVASVWKDGALVERAVVADERALSPALSAAQRERGGDLVFEAVVADGPMVTSNDVIFAISMVAGHDGVRATLGDKTAYVTPDDLLSRQLYDHALQIGGLGLSLGVSPAALVGLLASRLGVPESDVRERARLRRIRVERHMARATPRITYDKLNRKVVREAVVAAAEYLARAVTEEGRFRYMVDAPTNRDLGGYDWPRHSGSTYFLAQAAALTSDAKLADACRRAGSLLRGAALLPCGRLRCIGDEQVVALGSSALALLAFAEIAETGIDDSYRPAIDDLRRFLRAQQRPDGEFMHEYDRAARRPIDRQGLYYSSEATLALARAYRITHDPADLEAASRGLVNLVGPAWSFFGDRYYFGEEHWTCQAMAVLWPMAPDPQALDFCLRWQQFSRAIQQREGDSYFDADGAMGVSPVVTPRLTPVASRSEAAVATLDIARQAGVPAAEQQALDTALRRALALLVRQQFRPGPRHLFKSPDDVYGAMPGSEVDWQLRIDYAQHAGSAMVRWLELTAEGGADAPH